MNQKTHIMINALTAKHKNENDFIKHPQTKRKIKLLKKG